MYLARDLLGASLAQIGRFFSGRDHTTVLHACQKIARLNECDDRVSSELERVRDALSGLL